MQQVYISAFINPVFKAFNTKLLPLTLGHCYLFDAMGTALPFNPEPENLTAQDAGVIVFVCGRNWMDTVREIENGTIQESMLRESRKAARFRKWKTPIELQHVKNYITHYTSRANRTESKGKVGKVNYAVKIVWLLMQVMSEEAAWNMPLPRALAYCAAYNESQGDDSYLSERDEWMAQLNERIAKGEITAQQGMELANG